MRWIVAIIVSLSVGVCHGQTPTAEFLLFLKNSEYYDTTVRLKAATMWEATVRPEKVVVTLFQWSPDVGFARIGKHPDPTNPFNYGAFHELQESDLEFSVDTISNPTYGATINVAGKPVLVSVQPTTDDVDVLPIPGIRDEARRLFSDLETWSDAVPGSFTFETETETGRKVLSYKWKSQGVEPGTVTFWFHPEWGLCVQSKLTQAEKVLRETTHEYHLVEGVRVPKQSFVKELTSPDLPADNFQRFYRFDLSSNELTEERCYLAHYGLPEPDFGQAKPWPWWLILLVAGVSLIFVSKGLKKWRAE